MIDKIGPMHVDGILYYLIAVSGALQTGFAQDTASSYIPEPYLFYLTLVNGSFFLAGLTALKTYRSTAFADHKRETIEGKGEITSQTESVSVTKEADASTKKVTATETVVETKQEEPPKT